MGIEVCCELMSSVNRRRTQPEHNRSAYPPIADIGADIVDGSEVPRGDLSKCSKSHYKRLR
jgi:hypothetical protein